MDSHLPLVEPIAVLDTLVSELTEVEHVGGGRYRFTFIDGAGENQVNARLVLSTPAIFRAATWALRTIGARCCGQFIPDRCRTH